MHGRTRVPWLVVLGCLSAAVMVLLYQIPARHVVDIGGYDAAYVRGFFDPQNARTADADLIAGSDGQFRWSRAQSFFIFPQAGLSAIFTIRFRGWREDDTQPVVSFWLNGLEHLATFEAGDEWQERQIYITGGLWKPQDVVIELRTTTTRLPGDNRDVGILVDRVVYEVIPAESGWIMPYPWQVLSGTLAVVLLWVVLVGRVDAPVRQWFWWGLGWAIIGILFLIFYRLQPPFYPYPIRMLLPGIVFVLGAIIVIRSCDVILEKMPWFPEAAAVGIVGLWVTALLWIGQAHVTLSIPGVEKDFRVFATRTESLGEVFRADGFYHLGYPLLLWLVRPLTDDNAFLAARLIAPLSGGILLLSGFWLTRLLLHAWPSRAGMGALLGLLLLATSPFVVRSAMLVGNDMPFAACVALALLLMIWAGRDGGKMGVAGLAGIAGGLAFLIRHPGLVLLIWGVVHCLVVCRERPRAIRMIGIFVGGFLLAAFPQLLVNVIETGNPFFSQQAKNIWLGVYGGIDWGRWHEVPDSIGLSEVILHDPARFFTNWWANVTGFFGRGAEDASEFGQAVQLRFLTWPANWLAIVGLVWWVLPMGRAERMVLGVASRWRWEHISLVGFVLCYVMVVALAFLLLRFFLPLVVIYAAAAAWIIVRHTTLRQLVIVGFVLLLLGGDGIGLGSHAVLSQQPDEEVAAIELIEAHLSPDELLLMHILPEVPLNKYSAIAHRVMPWPAAANEHEALQLAAAQGTTLILWDDTRGAPPLAESERLRIGRAGRYSLYRFRASDL